MDRYCEDCDALMIHDSGDEMTGTEFAGPLAGSEHGHIRALVIVNTDSEAAVLDRLAADPWAQAQRLVTTSVEPWNLFVGADRISAA